MKQKRFMDIQRLKDDYKSGFNEGDHIVIQEKFDGSNASCRYDTETGKLVAFSRNKTLDPINNTLNGFYNYIQSLDVNIFKDYPNYVVFGEWSGCRNAIVYSKENKNKWYIFDIYDTKGNMYLSQHEVKKFAEDNGLTYIYTFYDGDFISWDHIMSFMDKPNYGNQIEGVVVKNMTRLNDPNSKLPFVIKIINNNFSEIKESNCKAKFTDPHKLEEYKNAQLLTETIVTKKRVEKELYKMRDDNIIPDKWGSQDMKIIAQNLPTRIYNDCLKEELDIVTQIGDYFGKLCSSISMKHARSIILGVPD